MSSILATLAARALACFRWMRCVIEEEAVFVSLMLLFHVGVTIQFLLYMNLEQPFYLRAGKAVFHYFPSILFTAVLAALLHTLPWRRIRYLLATLLLLAAGSIAISDVFLMHLYGGALDQVKIEAVMGTDLQTWLEFLSFYAWKGSVLVCVALFLLGLAAMIRSFRSKQARRLLSLGITLLLPLSVLVSSVSLARTMRQDAQGWKYRFAYMHFPLVRVALDANHAMASLGSDAQVEDSLDRMVAAEQVTAGANAPTIILILGESTDRNHMGLYGYRLPTTPLLAARRAAGELAVFTDTIAPANTTGRAMSVLFSTAEKDHDAKWYEYPSLIDVVRKADYRAYWLSNQEVTGRFGNFDKIFAKRSDGSYFTRINGGANGGGLGASDYDEALLAPLDSFLSEATGKDFYVLHLIGTHEVYRWRYPDAFSVFTENDEPGPKPDWKKVQAEYDNAVLYDDFVVNEIIKRFEYDNAILFFLSDHGMDLYDTGEIAGHTGEEAGSRHMIEIPFVIWASKAYRAQNPETWAKMQAAVDRPYRTDALFHTILDAAGIQSTSFDPEKSIFNDAFQPQQRIYNGAPYQKTNP